MQKEEIALIPQPNGDFITWGRHATINGKRYYGSACLYTGEDAEVLRLLIKYQGK